MAETEATNKASQDALQQLREIETENAALKKEAAQLRNELRQLKSERIVEKKIHDLWNEKAEKAGAPVDTFEITKALVKSDMECKEFENILIENIK